MTTFERRQRIRELLREQPGIKVTQLAERLDVSEGTIRNDLRALEQAGEVTRVRGGAIVQEESRFLSSAFQARARVRIEAKKRIARWAASLIQDGDSVLLDSSTTAYHIAAFLLNKSNLTIITNGIEVAFAVAQNPTHTIVLTGGILRAERALVVGHLGKRILENLHIRTAFVSCSGFTVGAGLTQIDIQEAEIKRTMIESAERVVAVIESSKFGKVELTQFASTDQISRIITDSDLDPKYIDEIRHTSASLTVCGEDTTSSYAPWHEETPRYKIGFANLGESQSFPGDVRRGLELAAQSYSNIDLILADNQLSGQVALEVADRLIAEGVDLAIEYQIDETVGGLIMDKFNQAGIPVIAIDIPLIGATFFGVDNYRAGRLGGIALGQWIAKNWNGEFDRLIVLEEPRAGALPAARIQGQIDGLTSIIGPVSASKMLYLNSGNTIDISEAEMLKAFHSMPDLHRLAVIPFNDDASYGVLRAARRVDREDDVVIVGQGADRAIRKEICRPGSRMIGSTAYWPDEYGERALEVAMKILNGEPVPPAVYNKHVFITRDNIDEYYPDSR